MDSTEFLVGKTEPVFNEVIESFEYDASGKPQMYMHHNGKILEPNLKVSDVALDSQLQDLRCVEIGGASVVEVSADDIIVEPVHQIKEQPIVQNYKHDLDDHDEFLTCPTCCIRFGTLQELRYHFQICKISPSYKCHICHDVYMQKAHLHNHMVCHAVERPCACRICGALFIHRCDLTRHLLTHSTNSFNETAKPEGFKHPVVVEDNSKTVPVKKRRGRPLRSINNISAEKIKAQMKRAIENSKKKIIEDNSPKRIAKSNDSSKPYVCTKCHKSFAREKAMLNHLKLHKAVLNKYYTCRHCEEKFSSSLLLQKHLHSCKSKTGPKVINKINPNVNPVAVKVVKGKHNCVNCERTFITRNLLRRHFCKHRRKTVPCRKCAEKFTNKKLLEAHISEKHKKIEICKKLKVDLDEDSMDSDIDKIISKSSQANNQNSNSHYSLRLNRTKVTNAVPPTRSSPRKKNVEEEQSSYTCSLCSKTFNSKVVLTEHIRWLHTANLTPDNKGVYKCTICKKGMKSKNDLNVHFLTHSADSNRDTEPKNDLNPFRRKIYFEEEEDDDDEDEEVESPIKRVAKKTAGRNGVIGIKRINNKFVDNNVETVSTKRARTPKNKQNNNTAKNILEKDETTQDIAKNESLKALPKQTHKINKSENDENILKRGVGRNAQICALNEQLDDIINEKIDCDLCGKSFETRSELVGHISVHI